MTDGAAARADAWFARRTTRHTDWPLDGLVAAKAATTVSVVIPARNEERTVGEVVASMRPLVGAGLVDEVVVMDSLSTDATARAAHAAGATVHAVGDVRPDLGSAAGKGEALWKSLFVAHGEVLVFVDADLTEWGPHFVTGLLGPLLTDPDVTLVKGFYDRVDGLREVPGTDGGRVTELVARPLLTLRWPELTRVVQPLAGEWAARRGLMTSLPIPVGYGVELSTLLDTWRRDGLDSIAQVDLGRRAHRHQSVHDLAVMATELLAVEDRRADRGRAPGAEEDVTLAQFTRDDGGSWRLRPVPVGERPPAAIMAP